MNRIDHTSTPPGQKDEWRTHFDFWMALDVEFNFEYDFAATDENALVGFHDTKHFRRELRYFTRERSALDADNWWRDPNARPVGFLNPPFSLLLPFMRKAAEQVELAWQMFREGTICILCPADKPETEWWRTGIQLDSNGTQHNEIRYLYPRLPYEDTDGSVRRSPHFPSALIVMRPTPWVYTRWIDWKALVRTVSQTRKR